MKWLRPYFKYMAVGALVLSLFLAKSNDGLSAVQDVAGISIDDVNKDGYLFGLELAVTDKENSFTVKSELMQVRAKSLQEALRLAGLQNEYPLVLTHGSLIVIHPDLLGRDIEKISQMLLEDWRGQTRTFIVVSDNCKAVDILRADEGENLRASQLSGQILRAVKNGEIKSLRALDTASRYLRGDEITLPLVTPNGKGYRISGSVDIRKAG